MIYFFYLNTVPYVRKGPVRCFAPIHTERKNVYMYNHQYACSRRAELLASSEWAWRAGCEKTHISSAVGRSGPKQALSLPKGILVHVGIIGKAVYAGKKTYFLWQWKTLVWFFMDYMFTLLARKLLSAQHISRRIHLSSPSSPRWYLCKEHFCIHPSRFQIIYRNDLLAGSCCASNTIWEYKTTTNRTNEQCFKICEVGVFSSHLAA